MQHTGTDRVRKLAILLAVLILPVVFPGCASEDVEPALDFLIATEPTAYEGVPVPTERVQELRRDVQRYEKQIDELIQSMSQSASLNKLLANELMQQGLFGPALEALQRAMALQAENPVLYYLAGVAAARSAPGHAISGERQDRLVLAEEMYRRALRLDPNYREALYGLGVLLAFELNRPVEALEPVRHLTRIETGDMAPRFLLANILVRLGQTTEAETIYDEIARNATSAEQRSRAGENRDALRRGN